MLVPMLWFFLDEGLQKVKARVPKELKINVISKKKISYESKQEIKENELAAPGAFRF